MYMHIILLSFSVVYNTITALTNYVCTNLMSSTFNIIFTFYWLPLYSIINQLMKCEIINFYRQNSLQKSTSGLSLSSQFILQL